MSSYSGGISTPSGGRQPQGRKPPKPPKSKLPVLPGMVDPATGRVVQLDDQFPNRRQSQRRNREILRRQRLLAGAGFQVVPDGVWGPRSQTAWNRYLRNRSVVTKKSPQDKLDLTEPGTAPSVTNDKREQAVFRRQQARRKAEAQLKKNLAAQRVAILNRASSLRRDPTLAKNMTLRQIAAVLQDREVDYHPAKNVNLTKALQVKLVARGYKVNINGKFDLATANALKKAEAAESAAEQKRRAAFLADRLYGSGEIKPGDTPAWWGFGVIPTKEKLLEILQQGGFSAELMMEQLYDQALSPAVGWRAVQIQNLARIAATLTGSEFSSIPGATTTARLLGVESVPLWMYMVDIIGVQDFVPFGDYALKDGKTEEWRLRALQARAKDKDVRLQNAAARSGNIGQAMALMAATSSEDFGEKMLVLSKKEEAKFKELQQSIASQDASWWGDAISSVFWVGEQARAGMVGGLVDPFHPQTKVAKDIQAKKTIEEMNPILRFAFEVTLDPINLVPFGRFVSTGAAMSLRSFGKGASLGRYTLTGEGLSKAFTYNKGTWSKSKVASTLVFNDPRITHSRLAQTVRLMSKTKDEAMNAVHLRQRIAHRLGWVVPTFTVAGKNVTLPKFGGGGGKGKLAREWLDKTSPEIIQMIREAPAFRRLIPLLKSRGSSLYADFTRGGTKSMLGAELSGYLAEVIRPVGAAHLAFTVANDRFQATLSGLVEAGATEAEVAAARKLARTEAQREYQDILEGFGTFRAGGADPKLADYGGRNLQQELADSVAAGQEKLETIIFPEIQNELERHADALIAAAKSQPVVAKPSALLRPTDADLSAIAGWGDSASVAKNALREIGNPDVQVVVLRDADGAMKVVASYSIEDGQMVLHDIAASPTRRGAGSEMMAELKAIAAKDNLNIRISEVASESAQRFFKKHGFEEVGDGTSHLFSAPDGFGRSPVEMRDPNDLMQALPNHPEGDLRPLMEDIRKNGIKEPIVLSSFGDAVVDGANRLAAAVRLGLQEVPVVRVIRPAEQKGLPHPIWDEAGNWRGAAAHEEGDLVKTIRETFDNPIEVKNHRFGLGHSSLDAVKIVTAELRRRIGRLDDYSARKIASGTIEPDNQAAAAAAHGAEEERLISEITGAWKQGDDGKWYDQRETLQESRLYARHLDKFKKTLNFDDPSGESDFLSVLGQAVSHGDMTPLEEDLFNLGATLSGVWSRELAGTGFRTPGLTGSHQDFAKMMGVSIDRRAYALRLAEEASLSKLLLEQGAVWRAFQYAQGREMELAYKGLSGSLALWKFATLALRPAWAIRNHIDNVVKAFIAGVRDPRYYVVGPGKMGAKKLQSVLEQDISQLRQVITFLDGLFNTNVGHHFDTIINSFWSHSSDVLSRAFKMHDIELPPEFFEMGLRQDVWDKSQFKLMGLPDDERLTLIGADPSAVRPPAVRPGEESRFQKIKDGLWNVMGQMPENYMRKVIYMSEYDKALRELASGSSRRVRTEQFYHGTGFDFDAFDLGKMDAMDQFAGPAVYLTDKPSAARRYVNAARGVKGRQARTFADEADARAFSDTMPNAKVEQVEDAFIVHWDERIVRPRILLVEAADLSTLVWGSGDWERVVISAERLYGKRVANYFSTAQHGMMTDFYNRGVSSVGLSKDAINDAVRDAGFNAIRFAEEVGAGSYMTTAVLDPSALRIVSGHGAKETLPALGKASEKTIALDSIQIHIAAVERALQKVEDTLFDYSKISVAEDNLKVFFPFIQFWRKNSVFWIDSFASKPWLSNAVLHFDDERRKAHGDQPKWMERYFHTDEIADALAVVPGLHDAFLALGLGDGAQFDPISMTSLAPFYRGYKVAAYGENQLLPSDRPARIAILGAIVDTLNDWGLGTNPFFRKPMEALGIANHRAWQRMFPQTALAEAIANATGHENIANLVVSMEKIVELKFPTTVASNDIADNFDYWVQTVVAEQVKKGEKPDIAKAEKTVRDWFLVQNLWGYFGGIYWRRATPEDMYLAKLQDDVLTEDVEFDTLSTKDKKLLHLWGMRGMDRLTYDRYIGLMPVIEAFYRADNETKDKIKKENPEIIRWTDGSFTGHPVSQKFIRYAQRYVDQELFFQALEIANTLDVAEGVRQVASDMFLSPELKSYWRNTATPKRIRDRMLQAEVHDYFKSLNEGYFAIPESDHEARDAYVEDHPEIVRHWNKNNDPTDDYGGIFGSAKADLRDVYFRVVESFTDANEGFEAAAPFLKQFPFMFEGTDAEKKVKDGEFIPGAGKWSAARIADFREAKPHLSWFFDTFLPKIGQKKAFQWLEDSDTERAGVILDYFKKYPSTKRLDYMKAQPFLKIYFGLPPAERGAWLRGGSEGAKIVLSFFEKYGNGQGQHAIDFLAAKPHLAWFFDVYMKRVGKEAAFKWLEDTSDPRGKLLLNYFKKYGKQHQFERAFKKLIAKYPEMAHGTPEQVRRMDFWKQYFALTPEQRPMFVLQEAEKHGIFIYGEFGEQLNHDREQEYLRRGVGLGLSKRQSAYLFVKPLLDFYRKLPKDERPLFVRANPELQWYFDNFTHNSITGDKKLDPLVEQYFRLPADSLARSAFLRKHSEVQAWFDKSSSPAERAMRSLLTQYFALGGWQRGDFLLHHPEIQTFFDRRRIEKANERTQLEAFDNTDPRLRPFFEDAGDLERAAERMRAKLRQSAINRMVPDTIETRRERRPAA